MNSSQTDSLLKAELQQGRALLASVAATTDVMLVYLDPGFNFVWVNEAYARTCRMSPGDMVGKNHFALYPHAENEAIFRQVRDSGNPVFYKDKPFEFADQQDRGTTYWDWSLAADKDSDGRVVGLVFSLRETTGFVRARQTVRETENLLATFIESVPAGIAMFDREMRYLAVSRRFLLDHRIIDEDVIGRCHYEVFPDLPERWKAIHRRCLAGETLRCDEDQFVRRNGEINWERWEVRPWFTGAGTIGGIILFSENVTDRKRQENGLKAAMEEAERANNAKSRFLAAASHDLRQPLSALSLYVGTLERKLPASERALASGIGDCVTHLSELLSNLLDLSKLEAGVIKPSVCDFEVDAVLLRIALSYEPEAREKGLGLRYTGSAWVARTDPVLFQRVVTNLVANAVRYTEHGGILIGVRRRSGKHWVEVWDTGIGIPADKTTEIFEEFRQLGNAERNRTKGSGIGLTIAAKTAKLLGLQLQVRSRPGRGSVFALELPLGERVDAHPVEPPPIHQKRRIAIVEDNTEVAAALAYALTELGHQVISAASRYEVVTRLNGTAPEIILADYRLGGEEDGVGVIRAVRSAFGNDVPALIITGDTDPVVVRRMADHGISVLHKPLDLDALQDRIAALIEARAVSSPHRTAEGAG
ncbi:hybrid sensor histidine kinase/response regulator [Azoarcus olearius]|uniref:histidine kinase n=1 Tax=Azoarcus sp. (strain BH72) TaxID=418699 RepID=A1K824_AZOSB|nr:hybrid sensor histidine kinase/response regulator [Azoarcus olearius]CAL94979.1 putative sensor kinase/response regulator hybrid protein [Azoarcus olearius]